MPQQCVMNRRPRRAGFAETRARPALIAQRTALPAGGWSGRSAAVRTRSAWAQAIRRGRLNASGLDFGLQTARLKNHEKGKVRCRAKSSGQKKPGCISTGNSRRPTLTESIKPLPSATQRFTAVFGMGTVGPLLYDHQKNYLRRESIGPTPADKPPPGFSTSFKELRFLENYTQNAGLQFAN